MFHVKHMRYVMEIQPNSTIYLFRGVPLDNTYTHTMYFPDSVTQYSAFLKAFGDTKKTFERVSYQRVNKGRLRLEVLADDIYSYNYMMFRNISYGNKWFYAFINKVEYVNDITTEIEYELDVMQTWIGETVLEPSFVVREHSATDNYGEHIEPEAVDLGLVICHGTMTTDYFDSYCAVIAMAEGNSSRAVGEDGFLKPMTEEEKSKLRGLHDKEESIEWDRNISTKPGYYITLSESKKEGEVS